MSKKKILFINGHLNIGGVERSLSDILKFINTDKYDVELLLIEGLGTFVHELPSCINIRFVNLNNAYGPLFATLYKCIKQRNWICFVMRLILLLQNLLGPSVLILSRWLLLENKQYDYVVGFRPGLCTDLAAYAVKSSHRIGWWHHGEFTMEGSELNLYEKTCNHLDKLITVSYGCQQMLQFKMPSLKDKIQVIPNFIDIPAIATKADCSIPIEHNCTTINIITIGSLTKEKHVENVIYAAKQLKKEAVDFRWYIVGDGVLRSSLQNLISETQTGDVVILLGNQSNPYPFLKSADLLVHTSYVESQCLVVLEAMSLGKMCVVTKSIGTKDFVVDGYNAIYVNPNVNSLLLGIKRALQCDNKDILQNAVITAKKYSSEIIYRKLETLFC